MMQITGFKVGTFHNRYLGTPLVFGKMKSCHFNPLVEKIACFFNSWSVHTLTYAGRLELLKAVIQGVESFWIQHFPIPSGIINKINAMCRKFLWAGSKPKVAWNRLCTPKDEGGLGLRDCYTWNLATMYKILWDIHSNKNSLWIKWIHVYYLRGKDVWSWNCSKAYHPIFKKIHQLRNKIIEDSGSMNQAKQKLNSWYKNGKFCTSAAYDGMRIKYEKNPWMSLIWRNYIPPKFSFILWLALRDKLNTKDHWLTTVEDPNCIFCKRAPETISHIFFQCCFVKAVWFRIRRWLLIRRSMITLLSSIKWIKKDWRGANIHSKAVVLSFATSVYIIWITRNRIMFSGSSSTTVETVKMIKTLVLSNFHALYPNEYMCLFFVNENIDVDGP